MSVSCAVVTCELVFWGKQGKNFVLQVSSVDRNKAHIGQSYPDLRDSHHETEGTYVSVSFFVSDKENKMCVWLTEQHR